MEHAHLDAVRISIDHEVVEAFQDCVVVARGIAIADRLRLQIREWLDVGPLRSKS